MLMEVFVIFEIEVEGEVMRGEGNFLQGFMSEKKGKEKIYCLKCVFVWVYVIVCKFVGGRVQGVMCMCV